MGNGESFHKPSEGGDWLEAWIDGARLPEEVATVYGRRDLRAEYLALEQQLIEARETREKNERGGDDRLTSRATERQIAERMDAIRDEMVKSKRTFRFRGILDTEIEKIKAEAPKGTSPAGITYRILAAQAVEPKLSWEQVERIHASIGEGQFNTLLEAAHKASADGRVDVPFSLAASVALNTKE